MELIIFTSHYPFIGEEFLDIEINLISKYFEKVYIITSEKKTNGEIAALPENVEVHIVNRNYKIIKSTFFAFAKMFTINTFHEILYSTKTLKYKFGLTIFFRIFSYYAVFERIKYWFKTNDIDKGTGRIYYSYWLSSEAYALYKFKNMGYKGYFVSRAHGFDVFIDRGYQAFRKNILINLDEIHFISNIGLCHFLEKIIVDNKQFNIAKLFTSYLGTKENISIDEINYFNKNHKFNIVTCSSIIPLKRLDLIVDTLEILQNRKINWIHFGDGYLKSDIKKRIDAKLLNTNIHVTLFGYISNQELLSYYKKNNIDVFLNVSDFEGIPVSIMEVMSFGIPVIARDIGGNSEIISDKRNGMLIKEKISPVDLANLLTQFMLFPEEQLNKLKFGAYNTWKNKFYAENNYNNFMKDIINRYKNKSIF